MSSHAWILLGLFLAMLLLTVKPMGLYIAKVMEGRFSFGGKIERPVAVDVHGDAFVLASPSHERRDLAIRQGRRLCPSPALHGSARLLGRALCRCFGGNGRRSRGLGCRLWVDCCDDFTAQPRRQFRVVAQ